MTFTAGPVFWILIALAIVSVVTYFERFFELRRAQIDYQDFIKGIVNVLDRNNDDEALAICEDTLAPVAQVVAVAIRNRHTSARGLRDAVDSQGRVEVSRLERRLVMLSIIGQVAPLLGLLGTVFGFIKTIVIANSQAIVMRADLLNAAMQALLSAAAGIAIAIPVMIMYASLRVRLDRTVVDLEAAASQILGYISTQKDREKSK